MVEGGELRFQGGDLDIQLLGIVAQRERVFPGPETSLPLGDLEADARLRLGDFVRWRSGL